MQGEIWKLAGPQTNHFTTEINYLCYFWKSSVAMSDFTETQKQKRGPRVGVRGGRLRRSERAFENERRHINGELEVFTRCLSWCVREALV